MRAIRWAAAGCVLSLALGAADGAAATPQRVRLSGEIVDTWCQVSGIMGVALGTAHHQCAIWCAVGGIPVGIQGDDGKVYVLLKLENDDVSVANPTVVEIQTDRVTVDADLYERDGVNYLVVARVVANAGIVNRNHAELGILPFGE